VAVSKLLLLVITLASGEVLAISEFQVSYINSSTLFHDAHVNIW